MENVKFMKLDLGKIMQQYKLLILFAIIAVVITMTGDMGNWSVLYMAFAGLIMSTMPIFQDRTVERGFYNLLPARDGCRARGRFLAGTLFIILCCLLGTILDIVTAMIRGANTEAVLPTLLMVIAVSVIMNSLQFLILMSVKVKSVQLLNLIRMIPGFIMFFSSFYIQKLTEDESQETLEILWKMIQYVGEHYLAVALKVLMAALVITVVCMEIAAAKERRNA